MYPAIYDERRIWQFPIPVVEINENAAIVELENSGANSNEIFAQILNAEAENDIPVAERDENIQRSANIIEFKVEREIYGAASQELEQFLQDQPEWNDNETIVSEQVVCDVERVDSSIAIVSAIGKTVPKPIMCDADGGESSILTEQERISVSFEAEIASIQTDTVIDKTVQELVVNGADGVDSLIASEQKQVTATFGSGTSIGETVPRNVVSETDDIVSSILTEATNDIHCAEDGETTVIFNDSDDEELCMTFIGPKIGLPIQSDPIPTDFIKKENDRISGNIPYKEDAVCIYLCTVNTFQFSFQYLFFNYIHFL